ncbi:MAG: CpsD/CapB family tyrosine-protein kinase [Lachnospiraceae bacterium]|nr:CpsD/CapB family tyrosine-protein kinase [Lachnospiraceae bacterium]
MESGKKKIELYENSNQLICAAIDRIVVEIFNKKKCEKGQTVLLTGCSPLAGTTSTCIGLAIAMANTKRKTILVDCDVRKTVQYKKLNKEISQGLADYLLEEEDGKIEISDILYETNVEDLSYIPCGSSLENSTRILCSPQMTDLISKLQQKFDCIIFDLPSLAVVPDAQVLFPTMDGIVLVTALNETRKRQIKDAKRKIAPYSDRYYGMIINKVEKDLYRANLKDYDYYFVDKNGEQKLTGAIHRKYKERSRQEEN